LPPPNCLIDEGRIKAALSKVQKIPQQSLVGQACDPSEEHLSSRARLVLETVLSRKQQLHFLSSGLTTIVHSIMIFAEAGTLTCACICHCDSSSGSDPARRRAR